MIFSKVLYTINSVKQAQKQGLIPKQKYQITIKELLSDFNAMKLYYSTVLKSANAEDKKDFASEVYAFFILVDKMHANEHSLNPTDANTLKQIYSETKRIKDTLPPPNLSERT